MKHLLLLALTCSPCALAAPLCYPATTVLKAGVPVPYRDQVTSSPLTPVLRGGEVYLPIRYVGSVLNQEVSADRIWNVFYISGVTFRVGEKEAHGSAPTIGGVNTVDLRLYDVSPYFEASRIYVPLKMLPWLEARRSADGTLKLVAPKGCPK
ncbi:hypothetical protein [Deinococcus sp.]|uniref:hypothetical protein n=1 Tax=Deinococcus sp. TaxID=47478 RepID=UPI0025F77857|nr:hypothetical protein [Deinococcus sp.]